ncbi:MAG: transposase [Candidatus Accumulibacter necessarius]|uniref:transposase n=1 Tax=Candidatus Accumulibacter necessarius TaxID=2954386 RepID=UPI002FC3D900
MRVATPNGRVHVVMTSLLDPVTFPAAAFAELYHGRWRIEEAFKRIKHRLQLEHTSGLSWHAARQDFGDRSSTTSMHWPPMSLPTPFSTPVRPTRSTAPWKSTRSSDR